MKAFRHCPTSVANALEAVLYDITGNERFKRFILDSQRPTHEVSRTKFTEDR